MKATVLVRLKEDVPDAPGAALRERLAKMGFGEVRRVRVGRLLELELDKTDRDTAQRRIKQMCEELLANGSIEEFEMTGLD